VRAAPIPHRYRGTVAANRAATDFAKDAMNESPYFDLGTGRFRFWVTLDDGRAFGATITKETLHYRFHGQPDGSDALAVYQVNRQCIDDAVKRRVQAGAREPIVLRDPDVSDRLAKVEAAQDRGP